MIAAVVIDSYFRPLEATPKVPNDAPVPSTQSTPQPQEAPAVAPPSRVPDTSTPEPETEPEPAPRPEPAAAPAIAETVALPREPATSGAFVLPDADTFVSHRRAYSTVFALWSVDFAGGTGKIPCDFAPDVGLQCLSRRGGWPVLRAVDRPAILKLVVGADPYYVAATEMNETTVVLALEDGPRRIDRADLAAAWAGEFVVLWRMPPYYQGSVVPGQAHASVPWLREQLGSTLGRDLGVADPDVLDPTLESAVRGFQRQHGLTVDGIVGPMTWIRVADRTQPQPPRLVN